MDETLLGLIWFVVLIFSLTFHEAGHAWAALRGGDPTAYLGGQVSLDPLPHIRREPFGMVLVPLLSFSWSGFMLGWASAPYDPRWAYANPRRAGWMSLAGPAANLILVIAAASAIRFGIAADVFFAPQTIHFTQVVGANQAQVWGTVATLLSVTFTLNLLLLVFNLIPFPPLDGSGALALLMSDDNARRMRSFTSRPPFSMLGIVAAWFLIGPVFRPIHLLAVNLLYPELAYH